MPEIYRYFGLRFFIYLLEHHEIPHVHAYYGEYRASIAIETGMILIGYLPARQRRLAEQVIRGNRARLVTMYQLAKSGFNPGRL